MVISFDIMTLKSQAPWADYSKEIRTVVIGDGVTSIGTQPFDGCTNLTSVTIPTSVTMFGMDVFSGCSSLTDIYYGGSYQQWEQIEKILSHVSDKIALHFGTDQYDGFSIENGVLVKYYGSAKDVVIPNVVTAIGDSAFAELSSLGVTLSGVGLTSVIIPDSVTSIGSSAFSGCIGLTSVTIPGSVTSIGSSAFSDCTGLTSVTIPGSVTSIGSEAFRRCRGLTNVTISSGVTFIGSSTFSDCSSLTNVTIPGSVTSIEASTFSHCSSLTSVTISDGVTSISGIPTLISETGGAFYGCTSLTNVTIPASVTSIGEGAFSGCSNLTSINVVSGNRAYSSVDGVLFNAKQTLLHTYPMAKSGTSYQIPASVTKIEVAAFRGCSGLTSVTIPVSVSNIGGAAFDGCSSLKDVYYGGDESQWNKISIVTKTGFIFEFAGVIGEGVTNVPLTNATKHYNSDLSN